LNHRRTLWNSMRQQRVEAPLTSMQGAFTSFVHWLE